MKRLILTLSAIVLVASCNNDTELPRVTTINPNVTATTAIVGGDVTFTGGDANTARGVCWSTSPNPTTADNFKFDVSNGSGLFSFDVFNQLTEETEYYFKAFAENSVGKTYGNEVSIDLSNDTVNNNDPSNDNPYGALINSRGCIECDNYVVGESFMLDGVRYEVADKATLVAAANAGLDLSRYCVSRIANMDNLFNSASGRATFNQDISSWDVSNVTSMQGMFRYCNSFNQDIGNWDVSKVTNMGYLFSYCYSFNQDIGDWDVSNVTEMYSMFYDCDSLNQDIGNWDVSNVTNMNSLFSYCTSFNQDIGNWDVSNVTNMNSMFVYAQNFNQDIGDWDVSNVDFMNSMFYYALNFNQDLTEWCVSQFPNGVSNFATHLNQSYYPIWGTCP